MRRIIRKGRLLSPAGREVLAIAAVILIALLCALAFGGAEPC